MLPRRSLGTSGIEVSVMSLGSWRTFERISRDDGLAVMRAAMEAGIDFLDDARYDDETGTAPMPTGYSEVVFGELFRAAGWPRDEVTIGLRYDRDRSREERLRRDRREQTELDREWRLKYEDDWKAFLKRTENTGRYSNSRTNRCRRRRR